MEVKRYSIQSHVNGLLKQNARHHFSALDLNTVRHHSFTIAFIFVSLLIFHRMVRTCYPELRRQAGCCLTLQLLVAATGVKHNNCSERAFKSRESNHCPNGDKNTLDLPVVAHVKKSGKKWKRNVLS